MVHLGNSGSFVFSEMKDASKSGDMCPPLQSASLAGFYGLVEMLLEEGANVNARSKKYGFALQAMIREAYRYDVSERRLLELVQKFLDRGAHVDSGSGSESGSTVLFLACVYGYDRVVQLLLENGANANAEYSPFGNALGAASSGGYHRVMEILLEAGADFDDVLLPESCSRDSAR
jgi:ankyrin repeat protein